jgi:hypothetical protein
MHVFMFVKFTRFINALEKDKNIGYRSKVNADLRCNSQKPKKVQVYWIPLQ